MKIRLLKLKVGDSVKFNGQLCKIVDKTDNLLAIDSITHSSPTEYHEIIWLCLDWIST